MQGGPLENKLLTYNILEYVGPGKRTTVSYDIHAGLKGPVPDSWEPTPIGEGVLRRPGSDITIVGVGIGIHRAAAAAGELSREGISAGVVELHSVSLSG